MKRLFLASLFLLGGSLNASAAIVYNVNRTIGGGSVVGTIQTDGTIGILSSGNIQDWSLLLTSPNLNGGTPLSITKIAVLSATTVFGSGLSATGTDLIMNFSGSGSAFGLQNGFNGWCLVDSGYICAGASGPGEGIFKEFPGQIVEFVSTNRREIIATAIVAGVPEPITLSLFGAGLLGAAGLRRRKTA